MNHVSVFSTPMEPMAVMAVELLRAEGIPAMLSARNCDLYFNGLGACDQLDVMVPETVAEEASEILAVRFSESEDDNGDESGDDEVEDEVEDD